MKIVFLFILLLFTSWGYPQNHYEINGLISTDTPGWISQKGKIYFGDHNFMVIVDDIIMDITTDSSTIQYYYIPEDSIRIFTWDGKVSSSDVPGSSVEFLVKLYLDYKKDVSILSLEKDSSYFISFSFLKP